MLTNYAPILHIGNLYVGLHIFSVLLCKEAEYGKLPFL